MTFLKSVNLPQSVRPTFHRVRKSLEAAQNNAPPPQDGFEVELLSQDQAMAQLLTGRSTFADYRNFDEVPEQDGALDQKGRVETSFGNADYVGDPSNGKMVIHHGSQVSAYLLNGSIAQRFQANQNGFVQATSVDLSKNGQSYRIYFHPQSENRLGPPPSEHSHAFRNGAEALSDIPVNSEERILTEIFLDESRSKVEARGALMKDIEARATALNDQKLSELLSRPSGHTPRLVQDHLRQLRQHSPDHKGLKELAEQVGWWQVLEDFPKLQADGLMRTAEYYVSPQGLQLSTASQNWDFDRETGLPIADVVVVGGGPGGLTSTYHLSEQGKRTVLFEAGNIGQAFSDANAKSVHQLRTDSNSTDLIYTANHNGLGVDVSLDRHEYRLRAEAEEARQDWYAAKGETPHGFIQTDQTRTNNPVSRAELFGHMSMLADGLANRYPDTFVCEKSPVSGFEKIERNGEMLVKVKTARGHELLTRGLVVSTGFVGEMGEHARTLEQFSQLEEQLPGEVAVLGSDHDLIAKNEDIAKAHLALSDRLLGRAEVREQLKALAPGSRVAFIGGGESSVKGALEVLHTNPDVKVDLYTSKPLEPYQTQVPAHILDEASMELALRDPAFAEQTLQTLNGFGTPITSESLRELLELESQGRVRVRELGKRFTADSIDVSHGDNGFELHVKDPEVKSSLSKQRGEWAELGMYSESPTNPDPTALPNAQMIVMAAGYDTRKARAGPLVQDLVEAALVDLENGMPVLSDDGTTSARNPLIAFNTASVVEMGADTTLQARAIRAFRLAEKYDQLLPARAEPVTRISKGLPLGELPTNSDEEFWTRPQNLTQARSALKNGDWDDELIEYHQSRVDAIEDPAEKKAAQRALDLRRTFPGQNRNLIILARRAEEFPESLSAAEKLLIERAFELSERTHKPL